MRLSEQVGLITGGGTGLGREIALQLAREGMRLAIAYSRSQTEAEQVVAEIGTSGGQAAAFQADLRQTSEAERLVREVTAAFGRLDLLIHNAATTRFIPFADLNAVDEATWDEMFALNTRAAFFLARAAAPVLRESGGGQIITTSSVAGLSPGGSSLPYCVSKAALIHLTRCLAVALAPNIRVNSVAPGLLMTRWVAGYSEERLQAINEKALLKKPTDLADVAAVFVMLARNSSITGQVIVVDAGVL
ncbi:MAG TPA: SDR family oxidoreductase [Chthonomonadaceae bacterium]|nr:SDR family oxidoreductase [Chthonomonadaceae bacterium]